ncbi:hypothetical protein DRH14_01900 [Candidatus Shapirobacteria bacterium]|nr:MAG: hypothetical protein DRH14_01900 [Candidatus Shapirobacteria bacterium]
MTHTNKKSKFFLTAGIAAVVGAVGGLLFAPQSGQKTRQDIVKLAKELQNRVKLNANEAEKKVRLVFGKVTTEARNTYKKIQKVALDKIADVKKAGKVINKETYGAIVDQVIDEFKSDFKATKDGAKKMSVQLKKDWDKIKQALS